MVYNHLMAIFNIKFFFIHESNNSAKMIFIDFFQLHISSWKYFITFSSQIASPQVARPCVQRLIYKKKSLGEQGFCILQEISLKPFYN